MNSCFALRIVTVWELWGLPAVCPPSRTVDARKCLESLVFRIVLHIKLDVTTRLQMCFCQKNVCFFAEIVLESNFVGAVCLGAVFSRASSSDFFVV